MIADKIYERDCTLSQDLQLNSTTGHCDSRYFVCRPLTTEIYAYDDPVTGWAYACVDNPEGSETCGQDDEVNLCVGHPFPSAQLYLKSAVLIFSLPTVQPRLPARLRRADIQLSQAESRNLRMRVGQCLAIWYAALASPSTIVQGPASSNCNGIFSCGNGVRLG